MTKPVKAQVRFRKDQKHPPFSGLTTVMLIVLSLYAISLFLLLFWGLMTSFKTADDWSGFGEAPNYTGWPRYFVDEDSGELAFFHNAKIVFKNSYCSLPGGGKVGMGGMIVNSILYSVGCAFFQTLVPFVTAYACAKYKNPVATFLYSLAIVVMSIPVVGNEAASLRLAFDLHLYDHIWGLWVMKANYLGVYFLVFYAAFAAQPKDYKEAAMIDGAGNWQVMTRIGFPLAKGEFFTVLLINFITYWNDYQTPFIYMPDKPTVAYNTWNLMSSTEYDMSKPPVILTSAVLFLLPVLILFLVFQKRLMKNLNVGGIKG